MKKILGEGKCDEDKEKKEKGRTGEHRAPRDPPLSRRSSVNAGGVLRDLTALPPTSV